MLLFLARHGNTFEENEAPRMAGLRSDLPLTARGRQQAIEAGDALRDFGFKPQAVMCGNLKRQAETAGEIVKRLGLNIGIERCSALDELDYGEWEGLTSDSIAAKWPERYRQWQESRKWPEEIFPVREKDFIEERRRWLDKVRALNQDSLAVTSNGVLNAISQLVSEERGPSMKLGKVSTGHLCALQLDPSSGSWRAVLWNHSPCQPIALSE
ncbi:MAG: histidine phosphatase family protein [Deltaproteobacteria bacterium]|nr:histidine phosphatase family protein [Deltaproteobacteria bacterium]